MKQEKSAIWKLHENLLHFVHQFQDSIIYTLLAGCPWFAGVLTHRNRTWPKRRRRTRTQSEEQPGQDVSKRIDQRPSAARGRHCIGIPSVKIAEW